MSRNADGSRARRSPKLPRRGRPVARFRPEVSSLEGRRLLSTFEVTSTAVDGSPGTLGYEIAQANATHDAATVTFDPGVFGTAKTIDLDGEILVLANPNGIAIDGPGADLLTISGDDDRIAFLFAPGAVASVSGLTITDGGGSGGVFDLGGAVCNWDSDATMTDCVISDSTCHEEGGGIANYAGTLDLVDCTITGNSARFGGGGIANYASLEMSGCTVSGNSVYQPYEADLTTGGGGLINYGSADLTDCTISGNTAGEGGGVFNGQGLFYPYGIGDLTMTDCSVSGNTAQVAGGIDNAVGTVALSGGSISQNSAYDAGGVLNDASMSLSGCLIDGNDAAVTGGVWDNASIEIDSSTFEGNSSTNYGAGGLFVDDSGTADVTDCLFSGNTSGFVGGGVSSSGTTSLTGCSILDNTAEIGGGLYAQGGASLTDCVISGNNAEYGGGVSGIVSMLGCSITGNSAIDDGGGVFSVDSSTLVDCTIADNTAGGSGGGLANDTLGIDYYDQLTLVSCTVSGNTAGSGSGGGIVGGYVAGQFTNYLTQTSLDDTIVAANTGGDLGGLGGFSGSDNLIGTGGSGGLVDGVDGNQVGVADPGLAPLGFYGGTTEVMPLLPGSPAIDAGSNDLAVDGQGNPLTTDQRGLTRIVNGIVDIGAFESSGFTISLVGGNDQSAPAGTAFANSLSVSVTPIHAGDPVSGGVVSFTAPASGASATFSASKATIDGHGHASVTATANASIGSYVVSASASGATQAASFHLTNASAAIVGVSVGWGSAGSSALVTAADGLRLLPSGRKTDLPWLNLDTITITLSAAEPISTGDVSVRGVVGGSYGPVTVSESGTTCTITLARPVTAADRLTVTIGNAGVATFTRRLDILPGDVNDDGVVNAQDVALERNVVVGIAPATGFTDVDGDGTTTIADYNAVRRVQNTLLPALP